jgi:short-subunit dehydrogenase
VPTDSRKIALITGASSGIGADLARAFAASGHNVILTARRQDRLAALAAELGPTARVIVEDLADPAAPARLLAAAGRIDVLVNNAGFGAGGRIAALPLDRQLGIIQVNVTALTALTRLALPDMLARRHGRILNVASVVSFLPCPGLAVYAASKAYVLSFSEALGEELRGSGVTVTCLCPGSTTSEFAAVAGMSGRRDLPFVMSAAAVARQGHDATLAGRHLIVTGTPNRMVDLATRLLPRTLLLRLAGRAVDRG